MNKQNKTLEELRRNIDALGYGKTIDDTTLRLYAIQCYADTLTQGMHMLQIGLKNRAQPPFNTIAESMIDTDGLGDDPKSIEYLCATVIQKIRLIHETPVQILSRIRNSVSKIDMEKAQHELENLKQRNDLTPKMHIEIEMLEIQINIWIYTDPQKTETENPGDKQSITLRLYGILRQIDELYKKTRDKKMKLELLQDKSKVLLPLIGYELEKWDTYWGIMKEIEKGIMYLEPIKRNNIYYELAEYESEKGNYQGALDYLDMIEIELEEDFMKQSIEHLKIRYKKRLNNPST